MSSNGKLLRDGMRIVFEVSLPQRASGNDIVNSSRRQNCIAQRVLGGSIFRDYVTFIAFITVVPCLDHVNLAIAILN